MNSLRAFFASMTGRIFLILVIGVAISAAVAWGLADSKRQSDLRRLDTERAADRVEGVVLRWQALPQQSRGDFAVERSRGLRSIKDRPETLAKDPLLSSLLAARVPGVPISAERTSLSLCRDGPSAPAAARRECWFVEAQDGDETIRLLIETPPRPRSDSPLLDPLYIAVLILTVGTLALLVARMASSPMSAFAQAADELGADLARQPLPLKGPTEVRRAAEALNVMQARLQRQMAERTHMLAAITHDLQTPMTRLRLRLEKVGDGEARERLLGDLRAMQTLIKEGLELARAADTNEERVKLDLRSLVESIAEDAADAGQAVTLGEVADANVVVRPEALRRCLLNLVENALGHGGSAELSVGRDAGTAVVRIRDHGPGVAEDRLHEVFEPFVRLEESRSRETGGAGLGLTIARTLAERDGGTVSLQNHPGGGAEAIVSFRIQS